MTAATNPDPRVAKSKAAVLAATAELLAQHGLGGATVDAVSARSGVAKTTIYRHWPDRTTLLLDAVMAMAPPCEDPATGDLRSDLVELLAGLVAALYDSEYGRTLPSIIDNADRDAEVAALLARFGRERRRAGHSILRRAVDGGALPPHTDVALVHSLLVGPVFYHRLASRTRPTRRQLEQIVAHVLAGAAAVTLEGSGQASR